MDSLLDAVEHDLSHHSSDIVNSDDDDPLAAAVQMRPFNALTHREEVVRLRLEGHSETRGNQSSEKGDGKKRPNDADMPDRVVRRKGDLSRSFQDPVRLGYCTESQGKMLFES